jgi:hypothetical protein
MVGWLDVGWLDGWMVGRWMVGWLDSWMVGRWMLDGWMLDGGALNERVKLLGDNGAFDNKRFDYFSRSIFKQHNLFEMFNYFISRAD